jgi:hypothetical protein
MKEDEKAENHKTVTNLSPRTYPYSEEVVGIAWSDDPASYVGGSVAVGRVFHVRQVKGDDPDKKGYPGPSVWGVGA